jgi:succinate dehydrogenase/fumarate reductase-like Fe-S protein
MPAPEPADTVRLVVQRGDGDERRDWTVVVPREPGMTLLDALLWAREHCDPALAFDFSCVTNNACRLCQARIDGSVGYLCTTPVSQPEHRLEPTDPGDVVRDLVIRRRDLW